MQCSEDQNNCCSGYYCKDSICVINRSIIIDTMLNSLEKGRSPRMSLERGRKPCINRQARGRSPNVNQLTPEAIEESKFQC